MENIFCLAGFPFVHKKKIPMLNWCSGMIGWETSQTIGTARIAWLSSNGGSVTSSHHDLCHDRHHNFQWSHPYCLHHCQRRHHHHRKHEKPIIFLFFFLNFCLARTRLGSASTIGTIGIVTSWPGDSHKQTNKNICHICNYRKQYNYNSHKYTNVNDITKQIPIILKDMTDARFKQYKKDFSCKLHKHFLQVYLWTSWSFLDGGVIESELIFYNQSYFAGFSLE